MHAHFLRAVLVQGGLFKVLREKLELKAPQERFKEQSLSSPRPVATASGSTSCRPEEIEAKPAESAVWNGTQN